MHNYNGIAETRPLALLALLQKLDVIAPDMPYLMRYNGVYAKLLDKQGQEFASIYPTVGEDGGPLVGTRHTWAIALEE
jgi:hypothetical protein